MLVSQHWNGGQNHDIKTVINLSKMWQSSNIWKQQ